MTEDAPIASEARSASPYAWYALGVLVLVYMFNFIDRQILSILAEDVKRDLNITDGYLGFLYGTAFGVFYALFGIPLGRLADSWHRVRLMTVGLVLWSAMTALSGFVRGGAQLAGARIGVGIGEATASPAAYSLLSDWFPKRQRATALAIYSSGLYLGGGLSLGIGALVVGGWNKAYPGGGPMGLVGWQAAFLAVGIPGLLLAALVATLKEPVRGGADGIVTPTSPTPFGDFFAELVTIIPPLTLIGAARRGVGALGVNIGFAALCAIIAFALMKLTGNFPQWIAFGIGVYAVFSWVCALRVRDPVTYALIWGTPAFLQTAIGYGLIAFIAYAISFWAAPYAERVLGASKVVAGFFVGGGGAAGGLIGVVLGGTIADAWRKRNPAGRIGVILIGAIAPVGPMVWAYSTTSLPLFFVLSFVTGVLASMALGAAAATTQDLVLPRMRGTATATFFLANALIGLSLGPSLAGMVSTATESLRTGVLSLLVVSPISITLLILAWRSVPRAEASLIARARAAGEIIAGLRLRALDLTGRRWSTFTKLGSFKMRTSFIALAVALGSVCATGATAAPHPQAEKQALDLAKQAIALRSVQGPGNQTPQVAALFKSALVAGGLADADVTITPMEDTAYLIGRWRGSDPSLKPLVISGHMDVVEAKPADWQRDPFTPVVENGYLFGRGATDMKFDATIALAALIELKRSGYKPRRDIIVEFSGDEETTMKTSRVIAEKLSNADIVLNIDGGGGKLDETTGKPLFFTWQGAEKAYADYELTVTNPGGHSSMPRSVNAINQLAAALNRIAAYRFKPEVSDLTRAALTRAADYEKPDIAAALRAFVKNPADEAAIATLASNPATVGKIGTTCVVTMISGGHALNALPQRATANINCRIFPGHKFADIMAELQRVAADPAVTFKDVTEGSVASDASPMRADFITAVERAMKKVYPGVPVFPSMASGASDSMWFRHNNVASYGASPVFNKESEDFSHGLNERTPISNIAPAIDYYLSLFTDLSK